MDTYLGIDQSYKKCALVFLKEDGTFSTEMFEADTSNDRYDQAHQLATQINIACMAHEPTHICIEGLSFGSVGNVTRDLAGLLFVIMTHLRHRATYADKITIVPAKTLKKFAVHGNAKKMEMFEALPVEVQEKLKETGYKKTTGLMDLTDAYYLAKYCHSVIMNTDEGTK